MAILNPAPRGPSMFPSGTLQSSRMMLAVDDALMPSLSSFFPRESPGCGMGTRKALIPCRHGRQRAGNQKREKCERGQPNNPLLISYVLNVKPVTCVASCLVFERLVGGGEHDGGRSVPTVSDPGFGAVQHPLVSVLTSCCGGCARIAAVTWSLKKGQFTPKSNMHIFPLTAPAVCDLH